MRFLSEAEPEVLAADDAGFPRRRFRLGLLKSYQ